MARANTLSYTEDNPKRVIFQAMSFERIYSEEVTDEIREIIRKQIADSGLSQAEVARQIGIPPQNLNRALQERGLIAPVWQRILDHFDLKIVVVKKSQADKEPMTEQQ